MRRIAIFVEGISELIFLRTILFLLYNPEDISFECYSFRENSGHQVPFSHQAANPKFHFMLVNIGSDERVLTIIREREEFLVAREFDQIIGLRDMYCEAYQTLSHNIDNNIRQVSHCVTYKGSV